MCQEHRERANSKQRCYEKRQMQRVAHDVSNDAVSPQVRLTLDAIPTPSPQPAIGTEVNSLFSTLSRSAEAIFMNLLEPPIDEEAATGLFSKCMYARSRCDNPRSTKLNGELHRLCHEHRVRATDNQQRSRRRQLRRAQDQTNQVCTATNTASSGWGADYPSIRPETTLSSSTDAITFDTSGDRMQPDIAISSDHSRRRELPTTRRPAAQFSPRQQDQCQYPGRQCMRPRALKLRGDYHRFCQFHRLRENLHQRASNYQRRELRRHMLTQ